MGKDYSFSANPAERYHREQKKKELKKNKIQRLRQRDERVIAKETSASIRDAIKELERKRDKRQGYLDNSDIRKLERLQKELKLVQKAEEEELKASLTNASSSSLDQQIQRQQNYGDPTTSFYYHATLNPYGVPPPGKPMVWHCIYGGTTMDIRLAGFPNEGQSTHTTINPTSTLTTSTTTSTTEKAIDRTSGSIRQQPHQRPPPPPPPPQGQQQQLKSWKQQEQTRNIPPSIPQPQNHTRNSAQHKNVDSGNNKTTTKSTKHADQPTPVVTLEPQVVDKKRLATDNNKVPTLPEPSFAVRRGKKSRSLQADIWASTEELRLEGLNPAEVLDNGETIELTKTQQPQSTATTNYKRTTQHKKDFDLNDPCCPAGENYCEYRADITPTDTSTTTTQLQKKKIKVKAESKTVNQQPFVDQWYYKDSSCGATQGPFTTEMMMQWTSAGYFPPNTPIRNGETGMFVPLCTIDLSAVFPNNDNTSYDATVESKQLLHDDEGVEARLAALREERQQHLVLSRAMDEDHHMGTSDSAVAGALSSSNATNPETLDNDIQQHHSRKEEPNDDEVAFGYPIVTDINNPEVESEDVEYPTDLYYPVDLSYPTYDDDDEKAYGQQPHENDVPAYPLNLEYTTHNMESSNVVPPQQPKAQYRGDKDVLAFMPSHVQVKRSRPPTEGKGKKTSVSSTTFVANTKSANTIGISASTSVKQQLNSSLTNDYEKFMEDINLLK